MTHRWDPIAPPVTGLVRPVPIDPTGRAGPTRAQARGPGWRYTSPGLVVPVSVTDDVVEQRILEAYTRTGPHTVVSGWAALRLHGGGFFDGLGRDGQTRLPVPISANGARIRPAPPRDLLTDERVPPGETTVRLGIRCTTVRRAVFDEMRRIGEVREMAVAVGAACAAELTSVHRMRVYAATRRWYRDVRMVREAVEMAVQGCRSPQEDRFRLIWEYDAGWGRPLINHPIHDQRGRLVAIPDLFDPERGVVGEYAGADHRDIDRHQSDIAREAAIRAVGLEYVEVVGRDLREPRIVVTRMQQAAARVGHLPQLWVLGGPSRHTDRLPIARD